VNKQQNTGEDCYNKAETRGDGLAGQQVKMDTTSQKKLNSLNPNRFKIL